MAHVVTQSCVGDGSCVFACPVNCIQPTPDDPAFELAEMLYIDPTTCVDCGACVTACPVDAIKPARKLTAAERPFATINATFHAGADGAAPARRRLAPVRPALTVRDRGERLRVAIVGSGPAAMYAAEELLTIPGAQVDVYERLPTPYGLVRTGVAPDHRRTRRVTRLLDRIAAHPGLTMHLGVEVGRDVTHEQLHAAHHAVIYAVGAADDRRLDVPGADAPHVLSATELVGWYTGHPDRADQAVDLSGRRAIVVGNGNVALDIARILAIDPDELAGTDAAPSAIAQLRRSAIEEVVVVARRGVEHSAFTLPELVGLSATPGIVLRAEPDELASAPPGDAKADLLRGLAPDDDPRPGRRITLRYGLTPTAVDAGAVEFTRADGTAERVDAGLVVTAIGFRGVRLGGLPYDAASGTIANVEGRVAPGTYVVGWIKRGPTGSIGTNKACSQDTVAALVDDFNAGALTAPPVASRRSSRLRRQAIPSR